MNNTHKTEREERNMADIGSTSHAVTDKTSLYLMSLSYRVVCSYKLRWTGFSLISVTSIFKVIMYKKKYSSTISFRNTMQ